MEQQDQSDLISLTADIVSAHVGNNSVAVGDIAELVQKVHAALAGLGAPATEEPRAKSAAVSVRASIRPDYIICMECGKKQKTLKRHIQSAHGMTPSDYRRDYGLPITYPMVAPNYAEQRRTLAKSIGLGRKKGEPAKAARKRRNGGEQSDGAQKGSGPNSRAGA